MTLKGVRVSDDQGYCLGRCPRGGRPRPELVTPLLMLLDQPESIRAYKLVKADRVGQSYSVPDANPNPTVQCGAGINVATLDWCLREWQEGYRVLVVEF